MDSDANDVLIAGQETMARGDLHTAARQFAFAVERFPTFAPAYVALASTLLAQGSSQKAVHALLKALELAPDDVDALNLLGVAFYRQGEFDEAEEALSQARCLSPRNLRTLLHLTELYRSQERFLEATEAIQQALAIAPDDPDTMVSFGLLSLDLYELEGAEIAIEYVQATAPSHPKLPLLRQMLDEVRRLGPPPGLWTATANMSPGDAPKPSAPRTWGRREIAVYCGRSLEKWSPKNLTRGIGGSEEAVIYLSRELTKLDWRVTVYGDPRDDAGEYDGVVYRPNQEFNPSDRFNVLVGWRNVAFFDTDYRARRTYLWLHDVPDPKKYIRRRLANISKIMVLSHFHRSLLPRVSEEKFMITANGIVPEQLESLERAQPSRNPYRCIYASSYDRGLEHLLALWKGVRESVPAAELHIYYGWDLFDRLYQHNLQRQEWKARMVKLMDQPGVYHHGRAGQDQVLLESLKSGVWAYPTHFAEISCITAMKSQAAGAVPVICAYAALKETVQYGIRIPSQGDEIFGQAKREEYGQALIRALLDHGWQEKTRKDMVPWAREKYSWKNIARQWDEEFRRSEAQ